MPPQMTAIHIFRRDLRTRDNTSLNYLQTNKQIKNVVPVFIFTPEQISQNRFRSDAAVKFMVESLEDLNNDLHNQLQTFFDSVESVVEFLIRKYRPAIISVNRDYTPYSIKRDSTIKRLCKSNNVQFLTFHDVPLCGDLDADYLLTKQRTAYKQFTSFYNTAAKLPVTLPNVIQINKIKDLPVGSFLKTLDKINKIVTLTAHHQGGGRTQALRILKSDEFALKIKTYPTNNGSNLSPHNKFGTISIREVYYQSKSVKGVKSTFIQQLYWRDFYYYICHHYPAIFKYVHLQNPDYQFNWKSNKSHLKAWKQGETGFPIIDAGMRELEATGRINNRIRMCVAMFLCKDLLINWAEGERHFSKKLVDIDRCQNIGNWNWCASFGLDNSPFLRIFNPWTQSQKFDRDCQYIKTWVPELKDIPPSHIHKWHKYHQKYQNTYIIPIVNHDIQRRRFIQFYNTSTQK